METSGHYSDGTPAPRWYAAEPPRLDAYDRRDFPLALYRSRANVPAGWTTTPQGERYRGEFAALAAADKFLD